MHANGFPRIHTLNQIRVCNQRIYTPTDFETKPLIMESILLKISRFFFPFFLRCSRHCKARSLVYFSLSFTAIPIIQAFLSLLRIDAFFKCNHSICFIAIMDTFSKSYLSWILHHLNRRFLLINQIS